jgi:hypothetical protein
LFLIFLRLFLFLYARELALEMFCSTCAVPFTKSWKLMWL